MESLTSAFRQLLPMSLTALPVMAVVLAVRFLLGKAPKKFSYLLWAVVAFRLVCPVSFSTPVGLVEPGELERRVETAGESYVGESRVIWNAEEQAEDFQRAVEHGNQPVYGGEDGYYVVTKPDGVSPADTIAGTVLPIAAAVWLLGMAAMLAYGGGTYFRLRRRVAMAVRREGNVWECDCIPTPFVLGFVRPRVYIPFRLSEEERLYVLAHERYHIRHLDHWVKLLGYLLLAVYWWNPAVWLCWVLCCRDMEMRCDEAVLAQLGDDVKAGYSLSLVSFALDRRAPVALAFGEHDAARRVKNVLNWKRARPAVVFLAVAAVALVAVVCGTDAEGGSWLEAEQSGNAVSFTCEMKEPIRSWAIYEDIYENGELISSSPCIMDSFQDDGGASPRELRTTLSVPPVYEVDGFSGELAVSFGFDGAGVFFATRNITLPRDRYTGMGSVLGDGSEEGPVRWKLEDDGSVALYTVMFSTRPDGGIRAGGTAGSGLFDNDTVLQYRFVTSTLSMGELTADSSLAQTLFDLRVESREDGDGIRALMTALGGDSLGSYSLAWQEQAVELAFMEPLSEQQVSEMWRISQLLLALVGNADQINYSFRTADGASRIAYYCDRKQGDGWARSLGYGDIKELGKTAAGIRALLDYLGWEEQAGLSSDPLDTLARTLYAAKGDPEALLTAMEAAEEPLGRYVIQDFPGNYLSLLFYDAPVAPEKRSTLMWRYSMVLLALLDDYSATTWNWIDGGVQSLPQNDGLWNTDTWLHAHGLAGTIRDYGASPEAVRTLLGALYPQSGGGAPVSELGASLFALKGNVPVLMQAIPERLIGGIDWELTEDGMLELTAARYGGEGLMSDASCLLLALLPEEIWAVRWTVDGHPVEFSYMEENDPNRGLFTEDTAFAWTEHRSGAGLYVRFCGQTAAGMTMLLDELGIGGGDLPLLTVEPFTDILGYDGFVSREYQNYGGGIDWSRRTYYAVTEDGTFPIAKSFGWDEPQDYAVDLDGDGQEELVCNVVFNADGAKRVYVYQRRGDKIWQSSVTPEGLPGYVNTAGIGSDWEEYDPEEKLFRIHYLAEGREDYAVAEVRDMSQMEEWYPYP